MIPGKRFEDRRVFNDSPPIVSGLLPPHDLDYEAIVIAACCLSVVQRDEVMTIVRPEHFYSDANRRLYEAIVGLVWKNMDVNVVTVAAWLRDRDMLNPVGGSAYIMQVVNTTPGHVHIEQYARRVVDKWRMRKLIAKCDEVRAYGYTWTGDEQAYIDEAEQAIYELAHTEHKHEAQHVKEIMVGVFKTMNEAATRGSRLTGISTGYTKLDEKTAGLHDGDLTIVAGRPGMGKTSLVMNIAVNVASPADEMTPGFGVTVFSLEMPKDQLAVRMICSEARVDLGRVRNAMLQPEDWRRLTEAAAYLSNLPIWIDDTAALTIMELRAKVRRQQAKFNRDATDKQPARRVGLVVVDYLQLMKGRDVVNSREQEISEISRGLKQLAKELKVPVIALSQLNRAVETRGKDKRPQLSDLRECIVGEAMVPDALTGDLVTMREIAAGRTTVVYGLRPDGKVAAAPVSMAWSTGVNQVYRVRTGSGRTIRCTANHPLRAYDGWKRADSIAIGERIAVPRSVPAPAVPVNSVTADELRLLGYLISDGHYGKNRTVGYVKADPALVADVRRIALERFGITAKAKPKPCQGIAEQIELTAEPRGPGMNPLIQWLKAIGVHGEIGAKKRVPASVFRCTNDLMGIFLGALWAGDGCVMPRKETGWVLKFTNTSMGLLDDVQWILTRLGIVSTRTPPRRNSKSTMDIATVIVGESDAILRFAEMVAVPGVKGEKLVRAVAFAERSQRNARIDRLPLRVTAEVAEASRAAGMSWRALGYRCQGKEMCRADLGRVAKTIGRADLEQLADSDILWDPIESVEPDGEEETFDMRVPGLGNFIVDNMFAHNSGAIEQDADNIIFCYRDEYYDEDTDMKGIAELIVAKQRNGPTGKVLTRFTPSCTRFDNLAVGEYPELDS